MELEFHKFVPPIPPKLPDTILFKNTRVLPQEGRSIKYKLKRPSSFLISSTIKISDNEENGVTCDSISTKKRWNRPDPPREGDCPFSELHYKSPCDHLTLHDKFTLLESDENVPCQIENILNHLNRCNGLWAKMENACIICQYLERLNSFLSILKASQMQHVLQQHDYKLFKDVVRMYKVQRSRCCIVGRLWCTLYHLLVSECIPLNFLVNSKLALLLSSDLNSAVYEKCMCLVAGNECHQAFRINCTGTLLGLLYQLGETYRTKEMAPDWGLGIDFIKMLLSFINMENKDIDTDSNNVHSQNLNIMDLIMDYNLQFRDIGSNLTIKAVTVMPLCNQRTFIEILLKQYISEYSSFSVEAVLSDIYSNAESTNLTRLCTDGLDCFDARKTVKMLSDLLMYEDTAILFANRAVSVIYKITTMLGDTIAQNKCSDIVEIEGVTEELKKLQNFLDRKIFGTETTMLYLESERSAISLPNENVLTEFDPLIECSENECVEVDKAETKATKKSNSADCRSESDYCHGLQGIFSSTFGKCFRCFGFIKFGSHTQHKQN